MAATYERSPIEPATAAAWHLIGTALLQNLFRVVHPYRLAVLAEPSETHVVPHVDQEGRRASTIVAQCQDTNLLGHCCDDQPQPPPVGQPVLGRLHRGQLRRTEHRRKVRPGHELRQEFLPGCRIEQGRLDRLDRPPGPRLPCSLLLCCHWSRHPPPTSRASTVLAPDRRRGARRHVRSFSDGPSSQVTDRTGDRNQSLSVDSSVHRGCTPLSSTPSAGEQPLPPHRLRDISNRRLATFDWYPTVLSLGIVLSWRR